MLGSAGGLPSTLNELRITIGPETYSPIAYNSFTVGQVSASVSILPGESIDSAYQRVYAEVAEIFDAEYRLALARYKSRLKETRAAVEGTKGRG